MDLFSNGDQLPNFSEPWNFSDTVLIAEDKRFHVHKSILAISSPVFNTMFQSGFKEATSTEIPLPGKKAEKIYELLCLIYPFPLQISGKTLIQGIYSNRENNFHGLCPAADQLLKLQTWNHWFLNLLIALNKLCFPCIASFSQTIQFFPGFLKLPISFKTNFCFPWRFFKSGSHWVSCRSFTTTSSALRVSSQTGSLHRQVHTQGIWEPLHSPVKMYRQLTEMFCHLQRNICPLIKYTPNIINDKFKCSCMLSGKVNRTKECVGTQAS